MKPLIKSEKWRKRLFKLSKILWYLMLAEICAIVFVFATLLSIPILYLIIVSIYKDVEKDG